MTALICIPCLSTGGTEIQTLNLVHALIQGNHQVVVACYFEYNIEMVHLYQQAGATVVRFNPNSKRVHGIKSISFLYKRLKQALKQHKPDIVHVQYMAPGAIPIILLKLLGIKHILATAHTTADIYSNLRVVHFIQKYCVTAFTCITEVAEKSFFGSSKPYTLQTQLKKRNHFTVYNALPYHFQIKKVPERTFSHPITLGVVSRLEKIKGMDLIIPAFCKVLRDYPDVKLLVVGEGSLKESMIKQTQELGISDSIEWAGRQAPHNLDKYYQQIDILLMPSRSEGFGLTAIEGMAYGCVVVASNVGGLPEVIKNKESGLLHASEDTEDIADKVKELLTHPGIAQSYSKQAHKQVQQFTFDKYAALINDVYKKVVV